ncbi:MAG TPA: hypothetical protein PK504_10070 [Ferruginibacter sp.]|nr:hypothetical protein [Ferruginibacter sp.]HRE65128.1 hypothetical protein [Ferruginibacter sp.]
MNNLFKKMAVAALLLITSLGTHAQIKIGDMDIDLDQLLGKAKVLKVQKGFSPKFFLGDLQLNKVGILGEKLKGVEVLGQVFNKKNIDQVTKLYKTYKTGLIVFKVLGAAGTAVTTYSVIRGATNSDKFDDGTVKKMLYPALASVATGVLTKVLTKQASYKAVDIFNGVVKNKVKDIFSIKPASETLGVGLYVQL